MHDDEIANRDEPEHKQISVSSKSYGFLLIVSKRLGAVATKSFVDVRDFLNQDVLLPSTSNFISNMPKLTLRHDGDHSRDGDKEGSRAGRIQAAKDAKGKVDSTQRLKDIVKQSHEVLTSANTVFPIAMFPDTVLVDRTKVTITRRNFFWSQDVMSIRIEDVLNVSASVGPLFGSLTIVSRVMSTVDHFEINYFWRSDAAHLKHVIQGYVIAQHNKIDTAHLSKEELVNTLEELGHDSNLST